MSGTVIILSMINHHKTPVGEDHDYYMMPWHNIINLVRMNAVPLSGKHPCE